MRFRTNVFPDEGPPVVYAPVNYGTHKVHKLHTLKDAQPKLRKAIISKYDKDLVNCVSECTLNLLHGNVNLSDCARKKLRKYRRQLRTVVDKLVPVACKKKLIIQRDYS